MRLPYAAALLALVACSRSTEGPTPQVLGAVNPLIRNVTPARLCNAQGSSFGWRIELRGERFAPMPEDVLDDAPQAALPEVTLRGPSTLTLSRNLITYVRPELLLLDMPTRDTLPPVELQEGSYTVEVSNPLGGTASLADALLVVPPPTVTRVVEPAEYSYLRGGTIIIEGTGFQTGTIPEILLVRAGAERPLFVITVVSPTRIEAEIPPATPEGSFDLRLTNREGCGAYLSRAVDIAYPRLGLLTLAPRSGDARSDQTVTLTNMFSGTTRGFSGAPEIFLAAPLKTDPTQPTLIPLRNETFVSATEVTAVVPTCSGLEETPSNPSCPGGIVPGGPYTLVVADPGGAVGEVPATGGFTVTEERAP